MNSVRTAKKTPHFTITKINWLKLFKEIIAVYFQTSIYVSYKNSALTHSSNHTYKMILVYLPNSKELLQFTWKLEIRY
jgi:hypothetical protein